MCSLLFVSHFHIDHVSGLERLLAERPARRIVAPILPPEDRLLAFSLALGDGLGPSDWPSWYPALIANPGAVLAQLSPQTSVTWIASQVQVGANAKLDYYSADLEDGQPELSLPEPSAGAQSPEGRALLHAGEQPIWIWVPWLASGLSSHGREFGEILVNVLPSDLRDLSDQAVLNELVVSRQGDLRAAYESLLRKLRKSSGQEVTGGRKGRKVDAASKPDLNLTSLGLYSGPAVSNSHSWRGKKVDGELAAERAEVLAWGVHPGWLGTGDGSLRPGAATAEFNAYFRELKAEVGIFAIPHHGSEENWNRYLLNDFHRPPVCVVGADAYMGWRHPGHAVVQSINSAGSVVIVATSAEESRWTDVSSTRFGPR